jgi:hypothetical protein
MANSKGIMQYFTTQWFSGDIEDSEAEKIRIQYWSYIDSIYLELPFPLKLLAKHISLHDGKIVTCSLLPDTFVITITCGDLQTGYFLLTITYHYSDIQGNTDIPSGAIILSDEIMLVNKNQFTHAFLFISKSELFIRFDKLSLNIQNLSKKTLYLE